MTRYLYIFTIEINQIMCSDESEFLEIMSIAKACQIASCKKASAGTDGELRHSYAILRQKSRIKSVDI